MYWPAVALILAAGANAVVAALIAIDGYTGWLIGPIDDRVRWGGVVSGVASVVVIWGGYNLGRLGSFGWALAGSIIATTPGLSGCCFSFPVGIMCLMTVLRADVRAAFGTRAGREAIDPTRRSPE